MGREDTFFTRSWHLNIKGQLVNIDQPKIMGIVNLTPDSFYSDSRKTNVLEVCGAVEEQLKAGAHWIDLGAVSTRPGGQLPDLEQEMGRLFPLLNEVCKNFPEAVFSIDTTRSVIAQRAVETGVAMVNDVSGGFDDNKMLETVARLNVPYILMHSGGDLNHLHKGAGTYQVPEDVVKWFLNRLRVCKLEGIHDVIIDPGIGFGKTIEQNFKLIQQLHAFRMISQPLLIGISRKSFIWKTLNADAANALNGTTALHMACLMNGAKILRVHDVKEAVETVKLFNQLGN